ncbi:hypothetical protein NFI96_021186 [Prochilodus magdalenae]|nr:hypothetical protein NFI96_021186 [Prochilodus magdalenae]
MSSALYVLLLFSALCTLSLCGTHQFLLVNINKTWTEAQSYCREKFTDLATIESQQEMAILVAVVNGAGDRSWIGLREKAELNATKGNCSWTWSDGSNFSYSYWNTGEPNGKEPNSNEPNNTASDNCVELWYGPEYKWNDAGCQHTKPFICYEELPLILINQNKTWREALWYCRENHVDLVSVHNVKVQQWVETAVNYASTANVWVGLRHTCAQSIWFWVSGSTMCYQNWAPGSGTGVEDCSGGERTGAVQSGSKQWVSLPETQTLNFICSVEVLPMWTGGLSWIGLREKDEPYRTKDNRAANGQIPFICYEEVIPLILINQNKTWREALRYCRVNHVDLVSVHNATIQHWVEVITKHASTANVWVGMRHTCTLSFWFWVSGESPMCYDTTTGSPGNGTGVEDCSGGERTGAVQIWKVLEEDAGCSAGASLQHVLQMKEVVGEGQAARRLDTRWQRTNDGGGPRWWRTLNDGGPQMAENTQWRRTPDSRRQTMADDTRWQRAFNLGGPLMAENPRWWRIPHGGGPLMAEGTQWQRTLNGRGHLMVEDTQWRRTPDGGGHSMAVMAEDS